MMSRAAAPDFWAVAAEFSTVGKGRVNSVVAFTNEFGKRAHAGVATNVFKFYRMRSLAERVGLIQAPKFNSELPHGLADRRPAWGTIRMKEP